MLPFAFIYVISILEALGDITATARRVSGENLGELISLEGPADDSPDMISITRMHTPV